MSTRITRTGRCNGIIAAGLAAAVCAGLVLAAPAQAAAPKTGSASMAQQVDSARGTLLSSTPLGAESTTQIADDLRSMHFVFDPSQVRDSVHAYRLVYRTVDAAGRPTTASGLFVLPDTGNRNPQVITYLHGTMAGKDEAPSVATGGDRTAAFLYSSAGYATVAPDYVGLGTGPGLHPYLDVAAATDASVDMLEAARTAGDRLGRQLRPDVRVNGFSQGGVVAMGLGRALQAGAAPGLGLAAIAPISGPYQLRTAEIPAALTVSQLDKADSTYYFAYLLTAWQRVYHIYDNPAEVFRAPYDKTVPPLYDGQHDEDAIFPNLPATPEQLITPAYLKQVAHPRGRLLAALRANDNTCSDWLPRVPVRFFFASGDEQVAPANTAQCRQELTAHGVPTTTVDVGDIGHTESAKRSASQVLTWFGQQRQRH
jgi:hypothetical protein